MAKIMVIEDEKNLRLLYRRTLEQDGHTVVTVADAIEGIRIVETEAPDLVVLDIRMPGVDGLDAMGRILDRCPRMPVILNSAYSSYQDNFLSWAADAYLIKSTDTSELRAKVRELLRSRSGDRARMETASSDRSGEIAKDS